jgi:hypothetical protein
VLDAYFLISYPPSYGVLHVPSMVLALLVIAQSNPPHIDRAITNSAKTVTQRVTILGTWSTKVDIGRSTLNGRIKNGIQKPYVYRHTDGILTS